jgi:5-methyltetrahydrofolate--homocysteine methyltransferase
MHREAPDARLIAKANAGIPQWRNDELFYDATPAVMGQYARRVRGLGASFIGGCCGNGPAHIAAIAEALRTPLSEEELVALRVEMAEDDNGANQPAKRDRKRPRKSG